MREVDYQKSFNFSFSFLLRLITAIKGIPRIISITASDAATDNILIRTATGVTFVPAS